MELLRELVLPAQNVWRARQLPTAFAVLRIYSSPNNCPTGIIVARSMSVAGGHGCRPTTPLAETTSLAPPNRVGGAMHITSPRQSLCLTSSEPKGTPRSQEESRVGQRLGARAPVCALKDREHEPGRRALFGSAAEPPPSSFVGPRPARILPPVEPGVARSQGGAPPCSTVALPHSRVPSMSLSTSSIRLAPRTAGESGTRASTSVILLRFNVTIPEPDSGLPHGEFPKAQRNSPGLNA